jgi:hypothetical protein
MAFIFESKKILVKVPKLRHKQKYVYFYVYVIIRQKMFKAVQGLMLSYMALESSE